MSRGNISSMIPHRDGSLTVTFNCKNGEVRSYTYDADAAGQILDGGDPADFEATQSGGIDLPSFLLGIAEAAEE